MSKELLFDTGTLIDIYKGRQRIKPYFDTYIKADSLSFISVISEAELWCGLHAGELDRHNALIAQFVVLPLRSDAARLAGRWMQQYHSIGLGWMDALIVATATVADVTVLTRDKRLTNVLVEQAAFELYE
jgi:predicted nucleic acid-binding protein